MTESTEDDITKKIAKIVRDWVHDDTNRVGPKKVLIGNNFDLLTVMLSDMFKADRQSLLDEVEKRVIGDVESYSWLHASPGGETTPPNKDWERMIRNGLVTQQRTALDVLRKENHE